MSIWAIADIHASRTDPETGQTEKPMDLFGSRWESHMSRLEQSWAQIVDPGDTVIIAGDIDWAMHLRDAMETLHTIDRWHGQKILLRGNHDYWWSSKTTNRVRAALPATMQALHNDTVVVEGFNICGAKGSPVPGGMDWTVENARLLNREVLRLEMSLRGRDPALPTIVAMHYPPFYPHHGGSPYKQIIEECRVDLCVYGHLHGESSRVGPRGQYGPTEYRLVAADYVDFSPVILVREGVLIEKQAGHNGEIAGRSGRMSAEENESLTDLAERAMADKRDQVGDEAQVRELYDMPSESPADLAEQQESERGASG